MMNNETLRSIANELELSTVQGSTKSLRQIIENRISELVATDINKLILLLYRLDVNEKKLYSTLEGNKGEDAARLITDLIIERQIQKAESRKQDRNFRKDENIPDDEKW